jgi:chromate transporter
MHRRDREERGDAGVMVPQRPSASAAASAVKVAGYFLRLGTVGFGGPIALVGYMQRDLVEGRRWFSAKEYAEGLAFSQLAPGPLAAQLAMYLGWVRGGVPGATLAGAAFVLPSFAMVLALSWLYVRYGGLPWMQGAFYGVGAAVIAIMARSAVKLTRLTLKRDGLLWLVFLVNAAVVAITETEILWVFFASGVVALLVRGASRQDPSAALGLALPLTAGLASALPSSGLLWQILWFFTTAGAVVFGSGLAIVPFLYGGAVEQFGWLTERQFLDAIAVSMITPGPVVITVAFVGFLVAGLAGATLAAVGVFLPVYVVTIVAAPFFSRFSQNGRIAAFVAGVTAAATGAIAGAAVVLARRAITDLPTLAIALLTLGLLVGARRLPEPALIATAGVAGVILA